MAKRPKKRRPKKKGPAPRQQVENKPRFNRQYLFLYIVGALVILSMTVGLLLSALS